MVAANATLENEKHSLIADKTRITEESLHDKLQLENEKAELTEDIHRLETENNQLQTENNQLKSDYKRLQSVYEECEAKTCCLEKDVEELKKQLEKYRDIPSRCQVII